MTHKGFPSEWKRRSDSIFILHQFCRTILLCLGCSNINCARQMQYLVLPHLWNYLNNLKSKYIIWAWIWAILYGLNISSWDEIIENWFSWLIVKKVPALEEIISNNIFQIRNKLIVNLSCRKVTIRVEQIPLASDENQTLNISLSKTEKFNIEVHGNAIDFREKWFFACSGTIRFSWIQG